MKLTPNFALEEFTVSDTALRAGIDNNPSSEVAAHLYSLTCGLEKVRSILGVPMKILSGYRCEALEKVLCQRDYEGWCRRHWRNADSQSWEDYFAAKAHPRGYAADFIAPAYGSPLQIVRAILQTGLAFDQLIQEGNWVHVSFAPEARGQVLTASFAPGTGDPSYTKGV